MRAARGPWEGCIDAPGTTRWAAAKRAHALTHGRARSPAGTPRAGTSAAPRASLVCAENLATPVVPSAGHGACGSSMSSPREGNETKKMCGDETGIRSPSPLTIHARRCGSAIVAKGLRNVKRLLMVRMRCGVRLGALPTLIGPGGARRIQIPIRLGCGRQAAGRGSGPRRLETHQNRRSGGVLRPSEPRTPIWVSTLQCVLTISIDGGKGINVADCPGHGLGSHRHCVRGAPCRAWRLGSARASHGARRVGSLACSPVLVAYPPGGRAVLCLAARYVKGRGHSSSSRSSATPAAAVRRADQSSVLTRTGLRGACGAC